MCNALSIGDNDQLLSLFTKDRASNNLQNLPQKRLKFNIKHRSAARASYVTGFWFGEVSKGFSRANWSFGLIRNTKKSTPKIHSLKANGNQSRRIKNDIIYLKENFLIVALNSIKQLKTVLTAQKTLRGSVCSGEFLWRLLSLNQMGLLHTWHILWLLRTNI